VCPSCSTAPPCTNCCRRFTASTSGPRRIVPPFGRRPSRQP
jgi:hypothetical protein